MLLLFDIDGTLIRSGGAGRLAMNQAFADLLGSTTLLEGYSFAGRTDTEIVGYALTQRYGVDLTEEMKSQQMKAVFDRYLSLLPDTLQKVTEYRVLPGVRETLEWLKDKPQFVTGLATGNQRDGAFLKLQHGELANYFVLGGYGDDSAVRFELLLKAWERSTAAGHAFALSQVWVIGDTPRDISAARQAGMKVAAVATGGFGREELAEHSPDLLWESMYDGLQWLQEVVE